MFSSMMAVPVRMALTRIVVADCANNRLSFDSRAKEWRYMLMEVAAESVVSASARGLVYQRYIQVKNLPKGSCRFPVYRGP
jgi:hypothetical protein